MLTYNNPESWNFPDRELRISENQVAENLSMCTHSGIKIPKSELQKYSNHIKNIASSKVSALKNAADDAGSSEYICYQYSESTGMYKGTIIKMEGDFTCENLNFYSRKVAEWMKNINNSLLRNNSLTFPYCISISYCYDKIQSFSDSFRFYYIFTSNNQFSC